MKLSVNDFAKIKKADITIDGITVIAGDNNTGKSTIGKIIFSIFNSLSDIEDKILKKRMVVVENTIMNTLINNMDSHEIPVNMNKRGLHRILSRISNELSLRIKEQKDITLDIVTIILRDSFEIWKEIEISNEIIEKIAKSVNEILVLSENIIVKEVITRYFEEVFDSQINSLLLGADSKAILELEIKGIKEKIIFENNQCKSYDDELRIIHKAIYIDNPFIVDELSKNNKLSAMNNMLKDLLVDKYRASELENIFEAVLAKEKLSDIYEKMQTVVDGNVVLGKNDEFYLDDKELKEPISFYNLSTGLKSFVILKMLIENGCFKEKDVLILDEPEIHLHPQWQVAYAEMIVLLQKHFDLSVIVTTHSPYFMDAIDLFSHKYGIDKKVNYYLSKVEDGCVELECVTDNIELIYKKMSSPIQMLESLRYELNNN